MRLSVAATIRHAARRMRAMRTTDSRATFLNARLTAAVLLILLSFSLLPALHAAAVASQSPPKIPGFSGLGKPKAEAAPLFFDSRDQVDVTIKVASNTVTPGGDLPVAVEFTLRPNWHIWPRAGALEADGQGALAEFDGAIRTEILVKPMQDGTPREVSGVFINQPFFQWPALHAAEADLGDGARRYGVYEGSFAVFLPLSISASDEIDGFNREQIPLSLAYAVTIHKAQGATLDCALIDIGSNTFEYGQAYVALSRVRSLDCLYIWDLNPSAFRVHPKVKAFFDHIPLTTSDQTSDKSTACIDESAAVSDNDLE